MNATATEDRTTTRRRQRGKRWRRRLNAAKSAIVVLERIRAAVEADDGSVGGIINEYMVLLSNRVDKANRKLRSIDIRTNGNPGGMTPLNALVELKKAVNP